MQALNDNDGLLVHGVKSVSEQARLMVLRSYAQKVKLDRAERTIGTSSEKNEQLINLVGIAEESLYNLKTELRGSRKTLKSILRSRWGASWNVIATGRRPAAEALMAGRTT
jgi:hypothetical protein